MTRTQDTDAAGGPAAPAEDPNLVDAEATDEQPQPGGPPAAHPGNADSEADPGPPAEDDDSGPGDSDSESRAEQRQQADAVRYRQKLRDAETERDQLRAQLTEYQRRDIAAENGVPVAKVAGDTEDQMRASAANYKAEIDAAVSERLRAMNVNPAAPAAEVGADGRAPASASSFVDAFKPREG